MADADIVELLADASRHLEAFELIVERYQNKVFRLAYSILCEPAAAEDAAQEALLRIWRGLARYRGESSLSTWIFAIARNAALSARKPARAPMESLDIPQIRIAAEAVWRGAPESATPDVMKMLASLPEAQRQAVILYYLEGKSYLETAAMLDLPMGTVKTCLHRARKELALAVAEKLAAQK